MAVRAVHQLQLVCLLECLALLHRRKDLTLALAVLLEGKVQGMEALTVGILVVHGLRKTRIHSFNRINNRSSRSHGRTRLFRKMLLVEIQLAAHLGVHRQALVQRMIERLSFQVQRDRNPHLLSRQVIHGLLLVPRHIPRAVPRHQWVVVRLGRGAHRGLDSSCACVRLISPTGMYA